MTLCDVCRNELPANTMPRTFSKPYEREGIRDVCKDCANALNGKIAEIKAKYDKLKRAEAVEWWDNYIETLRVSTGYTANNKETK